jgi:tRNA modification GTPase
MTPSTIYALASGQGRAGVAVIRLSGPESGAALRRLTRRPLPAPRRAALRALRHPRSAEKLDEALVLWMPGPHSFSGEDCLELHVHGGPAVIAAVIDALGAIEGLAPAGPGDFTRRAFEHGKLDLTAAEGLADLVDAETEGQRRQALRQLEGGLAAVYDGWRARLLSLSALIEVSIDFPDEDVPQDISHGVALEIMALGAEMRAHLEDSDRGQRVREGYRIAILGAPNAGKSSLLNALAGREAAIVSDIPGTTREVVEVRLVLAGFPVWIADTAGLREAADAIEAEGVRRALQRAEAADLRLAVIDQAGPGAEAALLAALQPGDLAVLNKADLGASTMGPPGLDAVAVSAKTGEGVAALIKALEGRVATALEKQEAAPLTRARHRALVAEAHAALAQAERALGRPPELLAEDVRMAARAVGRLTGRIDVEEILGEIFAGFCIGK